jgi:hypothetical protein
MELGLTCVQCNMPCRVQWLCCSPGKIAMLDVIYILIGAAFLGGCVLYAIACDHL